MAGKTAYVTGGASGIGRAVAEMLARKGVRVAIADANYSGAQTVASALEGATAVEMNATDWDSQASAFKQVVNSFSRIDYVCIIAGIGERAFIPNDPDATDFAKPDLTVLDVDLNGALYTAALAIQQLRRQDSDETGFRGRIAIAASVCGFYCIPSLPIYTAAKHGVVGFVRSYGKHLPTEAITLNAVCPNVVRTAISNESFYDELASVGALVVPMTSVVQAFERCLHTNISGEILEVDPHAGVLSRSASEPLNAESAHVLQLLHQRNLPLHDQRKSIDR